MNQIYRVVFNTLTGAWQAVSEIARGRSKSSRSASLVECTRRTHLGQCALLAPVPLPALKSVSVLCALLVCSGMAQAQQYWGGSHTVPNGNIDGGAGTWNSTSQNWTNVDGTLNSHWNDELAVFRGVAGEVTVEGTQRATGLQFVTDGYSLTGSGGLNFVNGSNGAFAVRVDPGATATINVPLSGSGQLAKLDSGTLVLNAFNTYTGGTLLQGGHIEVGNNSALGTSSGAVSVADGTSLSSNKAVTLGNAFHLNGSFTVDGSTQLDLSGVLSGTGSLTKNGNAALTLTGANTYSGGTLLNSGKLIVGNSTALGTGAVSVADGTSLSSYRVVTLANAFGLNGGFTVDGSNGLGLSGVLSGTGGLTKNGSDTLTLTGVNTFSGGVTLNAGTLVVGSHTALGTGTLTAQGGTTLGANASVSLANPINLSGNLTIASTSALTLSGAVTGSGGLIKNGSGTLTLGESNSYQGNTSLNAGTLVLGHDNALGRGQLNAAAGTALDTDGARNINNQINLGGGLTIAGSEAVILNGPVTGTGSLIKNGATSSLTLNGSNTFRGGVTLNAGGLVVGNSGALGTGALTVEGSATLDNASDLILVNAISLVGGLTIAGSHALTLGGPISGSGSLVKNGAETVTLTGANTYTGGTTINSGTLAIGAGGSLASTGAVNLAGAGTLDISQYSNQSIGSLAGVVGSNVALGSNSLTLGGVADSTYAGAINGSGRLIKNGAGVQTLAGANTFSGGVTLNAGGLVVGDNAALGTGAVTVENNASLDSNSTVTLGNNFTLNAGLTVLGSHDLVLNGNLSGTGSLTKKGLATLTLNGTNTYTGDTNINAGTLALGAGASLAASGIVNLASGATFDLSAGAGTQVFGTLVGNGTVDLGAITLTIGDASNGTFSGSIAGSGSLIKDGSGTETLTGSNTFTGSTTINAGTLAMGAGGSLAPTSALTLANTGARFDISTGGNQHIGSLAGVVGSVVALGGNTLTLGGIGNTTFNGNIVGNGALIKNGAGVQTLGGTNSLSGVTLNAGGLVVGNSDALGGGTLTIAGSGSLDANAPVTLANRIALGTGTNLEVRGSQDLTLTGAINGAGGLTKNGAAMLTLDGANTYAGNTVINSGMLALGANGALTTPGALNLNGATAAFDASAAAAASTIGALSGVTGSRVVLGSQAMTFGDATSTTFAGVFSGSGALTKQGSGTLTLAGDSSAFTGSTMVQAGSLQLSNAQLGGALTLRNGSTLAGTGSVGSLGNTTLVRSGATISPASTGVPGTLTVQGDLTFEKGAAYEVQVNPNSTASSLLDVKGHATLAGSVLHMGAGGSFSTAQTYTILHAKGGLSGSFDTEGSNYAYLDTALTYTANDVLLQLKRKTTGGGNTGGGNNGGGTLRFADLAETANQVAAANGIESLPRSHALYRYIETLPNGAPPAVFSSLSGDAHANVAGSLVGLGTFAPRVSQQHLRRNMTAGLHPGAAVAQSDGALPASAWPSSKALPAWAEVVGHWQRYDGDGNAAQLKQRTTGLFLGMDEEMGTSGWRLGGSVGFTHAEGKVADRSSESDVNSYGAAVYGGKSFGSGTGPRINVLGGVAYTWHDIATTRSVSSLGQTLNADYSAHTAQLFAEVGYAMGQYEKLGLEPFVGVSLGQQRTKGFSETGGFAALQGHASTDDLASTTLGLRVHSDLELAGKGARVRATVGWRHAYGKLSPEKSMGFAGGQNFSVAGAPLARNTAVLGLEADLALSRTAALVLGYQGELSSGQRDHAANVKLRWKF